ncbi:MAG: HAD family hydrolase, partial [Phycisphaerae bacterium]
LVSLCFAAGLNLPPGAAQELLTCLDAADRRARLDPHHREVDTARLITAWLKKLHLPAPPDLLDQAVHHFWHSWVGCLEPFERVETTLAELSARRYAIGLVSDVIAPPDICRQQLERLGLARYIPVTVFSSQLGYRKPHKAIYHAALQELARLVGPLEPGSVLFVGDSPLYDVVGPQQMGMRAVLLRNDESNWPAEDYQSARPELIIRSVHELLDHLPGP